MKSKFARFSSFVAAAIVAVASPLSASAAGFSPEIVDNGLSSGSTTFNGAFTTVTTTLGPSGAYYDNGTSPIFFATDASNTYADAWVKWSFAKPVTQVRVYYAHVESTAYGNNAGLNDPQMWETNLGAVKFDAVASGGNKVASAGDVVQGQPEASLSGNIANCLPEVSTACSGYVDLLFPEGISWIRTQNSNSGTGPGFNGVGLAIDAGEQGVPAAPVDPMPGTTSEELAETGADFDPTLAVIGSLLVLASLTLLGSRRSRR